MCTVTKVLVQLTVILFSNTLDVNLWKIDLKTVAGSPYIQVVSGQEMLSSSEFILSQLLSPLMPSCYVYISFFWFCIPHLELINFLNSAWRLCQLTWLVFARRKATESKLHGVKPNGVNQTWGCHKHVASASGRTFLKGRSTTTQNRSENKGFRRLSKWAQTVQYHSSRWEGNLVVTLS